MCIIKICIQLIEVIGYRIKSISYFNKYGYNIFHGECANRGKKWFIFVIH